MTTEFFPLDQADTGLLQHRLLRELARQAVLIAARDELGLPTRDETLGEPLPARGEVGSIRLSLKTRVFETGRYSLELLRDGDEKPLWKSTGEFQYDVKTIYPQLAKKFAELASTEIAAALRAMDLGATRVDRPVSSAAAEVDESPLALLKKIDFVSQYGVIRAAHAALRQKGDATQWQDAIVRGYAHLAILTPHLWCSHHEAFGARALLYAERFAAANKESPHSRRLRAYALALMGAHHAALAAMPAEDEPHMPSPAKVNDEPWAAVIAPYCRFQREDLAKAADNHPDLAALVALLRWELSRTYHHNEWIYDHGIETTQACPEAYAVYAEMARAGDLMLSRTGAWGAPQVLPEHISRASTLIHDFPTADNAAQARSSAWSLLFAPFRANRSRQEALSDLPARTAQTLLNATEKGHDVGEPSWTVLASLIQEEQFCQAAAMIVVSQNATEHSSAGLVRQLQSLVGDHRYWPLIASYEFQASRDAEKIADLLREVKVVDPRGNMLWLFYRLWSVRDSKGEWIGWNLNKNSVWSRSFTLQGLVEPILTVGPACKDRLDCEDWRRLAQELADVCPSSPLPCRILMNCESHVTSEKIREWRRSATDDPVLWQILGDRSWSIKDYKQAEECYQKAIQISPHYTAASHLASCYLEQKKRDEWQATLEEFLKERDLGLTHSAVHREIASQLMESKEWEKAESHAIAAAETSWSASGLSCAANCLEGLHKYEDSERWIAEACRQYPSTMGYEWFFWCRRTGHGDLKSARAMADAYFGNPSIRRTLEGATRMSVFQTLTMTPQQSLADWQIFADTCGEQESEWDRVWRFAHIAVIAGRLEDVAAKERAVEMIRTKMKSNGWEKSEKVSFAVLSQLCDVFAGGPVNEETLQRYDEALAKTTGFWPCNYSYFMGAALELQDKTDLARAYYRRAAFDGPFQCYNATLAGNRLVELDGPAEVRAKSSQESKALNDASAEKSEIDSPPSSDSEQPVETK